MDNIRFLTEILTTEHEYWIAKKVEAFHEKDDISIWFICVPYSIRRGIKRDEILLIDLEKARSTDIMNIPLSDNYPPFQTGQTLYDFTDGFPVFGKGIKEMLILSLQLKDCKDLHKYKELLEKKEETI